MQIKKVELPDFMSPLKNIPNPLEHIPNPLENISVENVVESIPFSDEVSDIMESTPLVQLIKTITTNPSLEKINKEYGSAENFYNSILKIQETDTVYISDSKLEKYRNEMNGTLIHGDHLERYLAHVDKVYPNLDIKSKLEIAQILADQDKNNNNKLYHNTAILRKGTTTLNLGTTDYEYEGEYLEFVMTNGCYVKAPLARFNNDQNGNLVTYDLYASPAQNFVTLDINSILNDNIKAEEIKNHYIGPIYKYYKDINEQNNQYSNKFKDVINDKLKSVTLVNADLGATIDSLSMQGTSAFIYAKEGNMVIKTNDISSLYDYMKDVYTHELGHLYDYHAESTPIYDTAEWKNIYNQLKAQDVNYQFLRDYAFTNSTECFAECTSEYYSDPNNSSIYNPNDLKALNVTINGETMTLYDYMYKKLN